MSEEDKKPDVVRMPLAVRYKKLIKVVIIALVALLLIGLGYLSFRFYRDRFGATGCTDQILEQAAPVLVPGSRESLRVIVDELNKNPRFEQNPNCVYIALTYYINIGDLENAQKYFDILQRVHDPSKEFNPKLGNNIMSVDDLKKRIEFLEILREEIKQNSKSFNGFEP